MEAELRIDVNGLPEEAKNETAKQYRRFKAAEAIRPSTHPGQRI